MAGNLLFEPRSPLSGNSTGDVDSLRYAYDEENRLIEVRRDQDNALLAQYAYDALGRRVQTLDYTASAASPCLNTSSPLITRHLMAGVQTLEETVHCTLAAGGSGDLLVREFVWGDRFPEPVALITHGPLAGPSAPSATSVYYYLPDILGSVLALADAAGNVVERYTYDPYGRTAIERHETSGAWTATAASSFGNPFAWTGQRYDAPVRLYHFLFRSYSPTLGRWLQRDPAGYVDGVSAYEFCKSAPTVFVDLLGLESVGSCSSDSEWDGNPGHAGPNEFILAAKDYDYVVRVHNLEELQKELERLVREGVKITDLYIFDHGNGQGQWFGKNAIDPNDPRWRRIGSLMEKDGVIHLRGCNVGCVLRVLQAYANGARRKVDAYNDLVVYRNSWFKKNHFSRGELMTKDPEDPNDNKSKQGNSNDPKSGKGPKTPKNPKSPSSPKKPTK